MPQIGLCIPVFNPAEFVTPLVEALDFNTLESLPTDFDAGDGRRVRSDLFFSVQLGDRGGLIYCLLEHQSTSSSVMALRMARYTVAALDDWLR